MPFIAIQKLRDFVETTFHVSSRADRDLLIDLAAAQELGHGLTMKQLVILQSSSATTTRRRIRNLIAQGKVARLPNAQDARSEIYGVTDQLWSTSSEVQVALKAVYAEFESRSQANEISTGMHRRAA